jgi:hypothetical protein
MHVAPFASGDRSLHGANLATTTPSVDGPARRVCRLLSAFHAFPIHRLLTGRPSAYPCLANSAKQRCNSSSSTRGRRGARDNAPRRCRARQGQGKHRASKKTCQWGERAGGAAQRDVRALSAVNAADLGLFLAFASPRGCSNLRYSSCGERAPVQGTGVRCECLKTVFPVNLGAQPLHTWGTGATIPGRQWDGTSAVRNS